MAQGEFTKEEAEETRDAFKAIFEALPKTKQMTYIGHANDIYLFLAAAGRNADKFAEIKGIAERPGFASASGDLGDALEEIVKLIESK